MNRLGRSRLLGQLHFPVGGPTGPLLTDVVEFLVIEGLADGRKGWRPAVDEQRTAFQRLQLAAAVRRHPETARLGMMGGESPSSRHCRSEPRRSFRRARGNSR